MTTHEGIDRLMMGRSAPVADVWAPDPRLELQDGSEGPTRRARPRCDSEVARATVDAGGFDGAVVMRVIGRDQQLTYQPGMSYPAHYGGFYSYYGYGWPAVYDPGYLRTDTIVTVETNVYSVADDKLLWSGVSETMNPNHVARAVDDVANAVARELRRQGLVD